MSKFKSGDRVKVVKYTDDNWYDERWFGKEYTVSKCYHGFVSVVEFNDETFGFELGHVELVNEAPSKLNINEAIELLQGLLEGIYATDVEIVLSPSSVKVVAMDRVFKADVVNSLEDICKSVVTLSGAELGD